MNKKEQESKKSEKIQMERATDYGGDLRFIDKLTVIELLTLLSS